MYPGRPLTPEKRVQNAIINQLRFHRWKVQRNQAGLGNTRGRPDLEAYKKGAILFIEVKAPNGRLSDYQKEYIKELTDQQMNVVVSDDSEKFLIFLEELQYRLWGEESRRLF